MLCSTLLILYQLLAQNMSKTLENPLKPIRYDLPVDAHARLEEFQSMLRLATGRRYTMEQACTLFIRHAIVPTVKQLKDMGPLNAE